MRSFYLNSQIRTQGIWRRCLTLWKIIRNELLRKEIEQNKILSRLCTDFDNVPEFGGFNKTLWVNQYAQNRWCKEISLTASIRRFVNFIQSKFVISQKKFPGVHIISDLSYKCFLPIILLDFLWQSVHLKGDGEILVIY